MLTSVILNSPVDTLVPSPSLLGSIRAVILSEGIYDIDLLLTSFPGYRQWFIESVFGPMASYAQFSTTAFPIRTSETRWLVIHSTGDTLVDVAQSKAIYTHLSQQYGQAAATHVKTDFDNLNGEHNDILALDEYVNILVNFILHDI